MGIEHELPIVFCPTCGEDYRFALDEDENEIVVICDCDEREEVTEFVGRLMSEMLEEDIANARMFQ